MARYLYSFICLLICSALVGQSFASFRPVTDIDTHLEKYSKFAKYQHDNIDDNDQHSHTHKHSENGAEHDHKHKHVKASQHDLKALAFSSNKFSNFYTLVKNRSFYEKFFVSSPHPFEIFRPPIS